MRRLVREIASGKGLNRVMPLDGSVTEGSLLNTGKPEISTGHHTPSLKRKDRQNRPYRDTCESMGLLTRNGWFREP